MDNYDPDEDLDSEDEQLERLEQRRPIITATATTPTTTASVAPAAATTSLFSLAIKKPTKGLAARGKPLIALPSKVGQSLSSTAAVSAKLAQMTPVAIRFKTEAGNLVKQEAEAESESDAAAAAADAAALELQFKKRKRPAASQRGRMRKRQTIDSYGNTDLSDDSDQGE